MSNYERLNIVRFDNGDVEVFYEDYAHGHDSSWLLNNDVENTVTRMRSYATDEEARLTADEFVSELKALAKWLEERNR